jgi:TRAP-type uncharacterized transport system substrate-binding protein
MDVSVINPCPNELAKLKSAGLAISTVNPKDAFAQDVGVKEIFGVPILFAYNMRADMPADTVYAILNGLYKARDQLVAADPGFTPLAKDFVGMQVSGINASEYPRPRGPRQVPEGAQGVGCQVENSGR